MSKVNVDAYKQTLEHNAGVIASQTAQLAQLRVKLEVYRQTLVRRIHLPFGWSLELRKPYEAP